MATTATSTSESLSYPVWILVSFFAGIGGDPLDIVTAAIIGALFAGMIVFALFYAYKRRRKDD